MSDKVVSQLSSLLADTYVLYLRTQNYHWNVIGPHFHSLHALFEAQYTDLAQAIDEIAERIRMLGAKTPGSFSQYEKLTSLGVEPVDGDEKAMINDLITANAAVEKTLVKLRDAAASANDPVSEDLAIGRLAVHQKALWMLKSVVS